ncbi:MAG: 5-(carboxyamino)imidazole ribonucleotide mutase [Proteobacteria bacterium]|nr:5-(carboxyamino)imidazole ribonucleotide mutase [Pseudomonadota bacterium]
MGSASDWTTMQHAARLLGELGLDYEAHVISAHRTPDRAFEFAANARQRGLGAIIAGAGGAAHLPGVLAAKTTLPVIGVPIDATALKGLDALLAIVQMPAGIPVATMAIGIAGAQNAALTAAAIFAVHDAGVAEQLDRYRQRLRDKVEAAELPPLD